jgi:hypothetical protein
MSLKKLTGQAKKPKAPAEAIKDPGATDEPGAASADEPSAWPRT